MRSNAWKWRARARFLQYRGACDDVEKEGTSKHTFLPSSPYQEKESAGGFGKGNPGSPVNKRPVSFLPKDNKFFWPWLLFRPSHTDYHEEWLNESWVALRCDSSRVGNWDSVHSTRQGLFQNMPCHAAFWAGVNNLFFFMKSCQSAWGRRQPGYT